MDTVLAVAAIVVFMLIFLSLVVKNSRAGETQIVKNIVYLACKVEFHYSLKSDSRAEVCYIEGDDVVRLYSTHPTCAYNNDGSRPFVLIHGHENMKLLRGALNDIARVDKYI